MKPVMADIGEYLVGSVQDRFDDQVDPEGTPWHPVAQATMKRKRIKKILTETSNLRDRNVYRASDASPVLGTNVIYAGIHQLGGEIERAARSTLVHFRVNSRSGRSLFATKRRANLAQWVTLPNYTVSMAARPFLGISAADRVELLAILNDHLQSWVSG